MSLQRKQYAVLFNMFSYDVKTRNIIAGNGVTVKILNDSNQIV